MADDAREGERVDLVVDAANVVGSRPDGWWRDRPGAARRLLTSLGPLVGAGVVGPGAERLVLRAVHVVLEGRARDLAHDGWSVPVGLQVVRAAGSGDDAVVALAHEVGAGSVVVTADRGLRARLPAEVRAAGPGWLLALVDRAQER